MVVDQRGPAVLVEDHDALAQRVQRRVVVGVERRDLLRLQAERLALEAAGEQQAEQAADGEDHRRQADQAGQQRRDLLADRVGEHADGDERDDLAVVVVAGTTARTERPSVPLVVSVTVSPSRRGRERADEAACRSGSRSGASSGCRPGA